GVGPDPAQKLISADGVASISDQRNQNFYGLHRKRQTFPLAKEQLSADIEPKLTKFEEVAGKHGGEISELHQKNSSFRKGPPDGRSLSSAARRKHMISIPSQSRARGVRTTVALSLALTGLLFFTAFSGQNADGQRGRSHHQQEEKFLFVWTGDQ